MPEGCTKEATTLGVGYTVYFWVDSVDEVSENSNVTEKLILMLPG